MNPMDLSDISRENDRITFLLDHISVPIALVSPSKTFSFANTEYCEIFGLKLKDIQHRPVKDVLGSVYTVAEPHLDAALSGEQVTFLLDLPLDPETRHMRVRYVPEYSSPGVVRNIIVTVVDITREKDALTSANRNMSLVNIAMRAGGLGLVEYYPKEDRVVWDDSTYILYGVDRAEGPAKRDRLRQLIHEADLEMWDARFNRAMSDPSLSAYNSRYRIRHAPSSSVRWIDMQGKVTFEDGAPVHMVGVAHDVTDLIEETKHRDMLILELDHRVKNMFSVISGLVSMIAREVDDPREVAKSLRKRINALAKAHELVRPSLMRSSSENYAVSLEVLVKSLLKQSILAGKSIDLEMEEAYLKTYAASALALFFQELVSNAERHGALAHKDGALVLKSAKCDDGIAIEWVETGLAQSFEGSQPGFGMTMMNLNLVQQLDGTLEIDGDADSLTVNAFIPM
jgi:two-component sensor histidine kinase